MNTITSFGFYKMYFNQLRHVETSKEAFNKANEFTRVLTGNSFYKSFKDFKKGKHNKD